MWRAQHIACAMILGLRPQPHQKWSWLVSLGGSQWAFFLFWVAFPVSFNDALWLESEINPFPFMLFLVMAFIPATENKQGQLLHPFVCLFVLVWQCTETRERHQYPVLLLFILFPWERMSYWTWIYAYGQWAPVILLYLPFTVLGSQIQVYMASCGCSCSHQSK